MVQVNHPPQTPGEPANGAPTAGQSADAHADKSVITAQSNLTPADHTMLDRFEHGLSLGGPDPAPPTSISVEYNSPPVIPPPVIPPPVIPPPVIPDVTPDIIIEAKAPNASSSGAETTKPEAAKPAEKPVVTVPPPTVFKKFERQPAARISAMRADQSRHHDAGTANPVRHHAAPRSGAEQQAATDLLNRVSDWDAKKRNGTPETQTDPTNTLEAQKQKDWSKKAAERINKNYGIVTP